MPEFTAKVDARSVAGCIAGLDAILAAAVKSTPAAVLQGAAIIQADARRHASGRPGPNVISGDLRRSIVVGAGVTAGPMAPGTARIGPYRWSSVIGPTVIYGRIQELGGHIYPKHTTASGAPGWLGWGGTAGNRTHFARHVYVPPRPYLAPGLAQSLPAVGARFYAVWAAAMKGRVVAPVMPPDSGFTPPLTHSAAYIKRARAESSAGYKHGDYNWAAGVKFRKPGEKK